MPHDHDDVTDEVTDPAVTPPAGPTPGVDIDIEAYPFTGLAMLHAGIRPVTQVALRNAGDEALVDLTVRVTCEPAFAEPFEARLDRLEGGDVHVLSEVKLSLSPAFLADQAERVSGRLVVEVLVGGEARGRGVHDVAVLPPSHWPGVGVLPELLAAWVRPNAGAIQDALKAATDRLEALSGKRSFSGYQSRDRAFVAQMAQAIYEAVALSGVDYISPPASFERHGQKVRPPSEVLERGLATCLDLTVVLAACLEQAGLSPLLVVVEGHAFVGLWLQEYQLHEPVLEDPGPLLKRVELGEALVFDSSPVADGRSFAEAVMGAERMLRDIDSFVCVVDVVVARSFSVLPLPGDGAPVVARGGPGAGGVIDAELDLSARWRGADDDETVARTIDRLDKWKAKLLDLSLRNRLLNFRPGKLTVRLPFCDLATLEDVLSMEGSVTVEHRPEVRLVEAAETTEKDRARAVFEARRELGLEGQGSGRVFADAAPQELSDALLELYRRSRSAMQESGAITLYVAMGMLEWVEKPKGRRREGDPVIRQAPLVLVPVELKRPSRGKPWELVGVEEDARINVTLLQKLKTEYDFDVSGLEVPPTDDAGLDLPMILRRMRALVTDVEGWYVREVAWVAQFSFAKFLMWLDLEAKREALLKNDVFRHMFEGKGAAYPLAAPLVTEAELERARGVRQTATVLDADPSQLQAIVAAMDGSSFVMQGPPGTGKSQTITNLIGRLVAEGKSVLFVSEKMAALQVVHRRLERVGLGPFCLELHSNKARPTQVMAQLKESFAYAEQQAPEGWARTVGELEAVRTQLNDHAMRLAALTPFGLSVQGVLASLFGLSDAPRIPLGGLKAYSLDAAGLDRVMGRAHALRLALEGVGVPHTHPWRWVAQGRWNPGWATSLVREMGVVVEAAAEVTASRDALASMLRVAPEALGRLDQDRLRQLLRLIGQTPAPPAALLEATGFRGRIAVLRERTDEARRVAEARGEALATWHESVFEQDLGPWVQAFGAWAHSFFLVAFFMLWSARRSLAVHAREALPATPEVPGALDGVAQVREATEQVEGWHDEQRRLLGPAWQGLASNWDEVDTVLLWAEALQASLLMLSAAAPEVDLRDRVVALCTDEAALVVAGGPLEQSLRRFDKAGAAWDVALAQLDRIAGGAVAQVASGSGPDDVAVACEAALAEPDALRLWCAWLREREAALGAGLEMVVDAVEGGSVSAADLEPVLTRSLRQDWWEAHLQRVPELAQFEGRTHAALISSFRALDEASLQLAQRQVSAELAARVPNLHAPGDEMALIRRQMTLKRRHMPVRTLFRKVPNLVRSLKPCMLMSPLSVAQYLDPDLEGFDVVVFDEASQIPPWDAVGAIARGHQVVVVGDSKQLPPTTFFDHGGGDDDDLPDDEDLEEQESILDEAVAAGLRQLPLKWHYRSRHESLITFSNHHYYDNLLHTFPSADHEAVGRGVELRHVPDGFYDRGRSRTNAAEAQETVDEVVRLLSLPDGARPTVGVVTFSMAQQRRIEELLEAAVADKPELQLLLGDGTDEPVFVKNLENVQGDERDVMLFSIGYGPDAQGRVSMNFGPLNRKGGERRLNVAVTRARERLVVFSTLRHDQIDLARTRAVGVRHLKNFLRYAELGAGALDAELEVSGTITFESPFEEEVHHFLTQAGYRVETQVGSSGYRIDLAVVDPDRPGSFVVAVECDGATYHSAPTARARDRLRDSVLEGLGWRMHRIWSTDWWYARKAAEAELIAAVDDALAAARARAVAPVVTAPSAAPATPEALLSRLSEAAQDPVPVDVDAALQAGGGPRTYPAEASRWEGLPPVSAGDKDDFYDHRQTRRVAEGLIELVARVGPVGADAAYRHVATEWDWSGLGKRIRARLEASLHSVPADGRPVVRGDELWPAGLAPAAFRGFHYVEEGDEPRDLDAVTDAEVGNIIQWVVDAGLSMSREAAGREALTVLGWSRYTKKAKAKTEAGIRSAVARGLVVEDGERLVSPSVT